METRFFTIGHSNRTTDEFVSILAQAGVRAVVDVRTMPRSRANPQFNTEALPPALAAAGIGYAYVRPLGGLRGRSRSVPPEVNGYWENQSFHNYADYAMSDDFRAGLERLRELGAAAPCAIMCAEAVWWRCHRRIIADYLLAGGDSVQHLLGGGRVEPAKLTEAAVIHPDGRLTYPAAQAVLPLRADAAG